MFDRAKLKSRLAALAAKGVFIGTSSWKYSGWCGQIYEEQRYVYRGKFAKSRFEDNCLTEYAETFKTVCVDAGYYRFFDDRYIGGLVSQVPSDFLFTFKVTDKITIKKFPNLPKHGPDAGKPNENFLNADLFASAFVKPFESYKSNVAMFIFEFSKFYPSDYEHGRDFLADLDRFLSAIPKSWKYGVEIRNKHFLKPEYFALLAKHGVTNVFNSWTDMPPVDEQLALPDSLTTPEFSGARLLLKPGRKYDQAVRMFEPYNETKEVYEQARKMAAQLIRRVTKAQALRMLFIYINNRLEGNALRTAWSILEELDLGESSSAPL